jgi:catechol-2,3-dioxygenase
MHLCIPALDLTEAITFYQTFFDLRLECIEDGTAQMYFGPHRVSIRKTSVDSDSLQRHTSDRRIFSRHIGFAVSNPSKVEALAVHFKTKGLKHFGPLRRRDAIALFCADPSGNQIEVYYDLLLQEAV